MHTELWRGIIEYENNPLRMVIGVNYSPEHWAFVPASELEDLIEQLKSIQYQIDFDESLENIAAHLEVYCKTSEVDWNEFVAEVRELEGSIDFRVRYLLGLT